MRKVEKRLSRHFKKPNRCFTRGSTLPHIIFYFEMDFLTNNNVPVQLIELNLFLLMYADAMVIFAKSAEELQTMLNTL